MDISNQPITNQDPLACPISPASLKETALNSLLTSDGKYSAYVSKIQNLIKDSTSVELFSHLLNELCFDAYICKEEASFDHEEVAQLSAFMLKIWNTASKDLKTQYFHSGDYIDKLLFRLKDATGTETISFSWKPRVCYKHDKAFFLQLFLDMPLEMRRRIWRDYWRFFVARFRSETLSYLMSLCLVDQHKIQTFVVNEMLNYAKIETIAESWSRRRLFYEVIDYSSLCSWNIQLVRDFRTRVFSVIISSLRSTPRYGISIIHPRIREQYIEDILQFDFQNAGDFLVKKFEEDFSKVMFWMMKRFTPTQRSLRERKLLVNHWYYFLVIEKHDQDHLARWKEFISWWDCETIDYPMFKQFLPIDDIFQDLLLQVVQNLIVYLGPIEICRTEPVPPRSIKTKEFKILDDFLIWYFGTEIAVENYKTSKVFSFDETPWLESLFEANNECFINNLLDWFFHGEFYEIVYFKDNFIKKTHKNTKNFGETYVLPETQKSFPKTCSVPQKKIKLLNLQI